MHRAFIPIICGLLLAGCEQLGIEDPGKAAAAKEAEGRAIGSACRHSGRALEDCYAMNKKASKAAIFTGWRDMDAYMRENNIEVVPPSGLPPEPKKAESPAEAPPAPPAPDGKPAPAQGSADLPQRAAGGKMV